MKKITLKTLFKNFHIEFILFSFIILLLFYGLLVVWSASGQDINIIKRKIIQIFIGLLVMLLLAQISPKFYEMWAPYLYIFCIILLLIVDVYGQTSKGAQRWLTIGSVRFQPSEIAKIATPLMIARYFNRNTFPPSFKDNIITLILTFIPTWLVAKQPDLGTAILIASSGLFVLFLAGISWKFIMVILSTIMIIIPILWKFFMYDYQKKRINILLNPESDPLGSGYHILQSKIAIGSGGWTGKGWLNGTQSQLEFLPERHTDFILSVLGEEFGFIGIIILFILYFQIIIRGLLISKKTQNTFGRLTIGSFILVFFVYIFVNISMVSGILPVVGIPLPLISYGGSSLIMLMASFGIIMSIFSHKKMISKIL